MSYCNHAWSEEYKLATRNPHMRVLHHQCIITAGHEHWTRPMPHKCSCDPVWEFSGSDTDPMDR